MEKEKGWAVTVSVDGREILTISRNELSGDADISDYREFILLAADHLKAFIGEKKSKDITGDGIPF